MKCHAGVKFPDGKPCPKCGAKLGEVCWPGINADLLEVVELRKENERMKKALGRIQRGSLSVLLDAALSESPINPDVLNEICKDAGEALPPAHHEAPEKTGASQS